MFYASQAELHSPQLVYLLKGQNTLLFYLLYNYLLWWTVILRTIVPRLGSVCGAFPGWDPGVDLPFRIHAWVISPVSPRLAETGTVSAWFLGLMRSNYVLNEVIHVCHFVCVFFSIHLLLDLFLNCKLVSSRLLCLMWFGNQKKIYM